MQSQHSWLKDDALWVIPNIPCSHYDSYPSMTFHGILSNQNMHVPYSSYGKTLPGSRAFNPLIISNDKDLLWKTDGHKHLWHWANCHQLLLSVGSASSRVNINTMLYPVTHVNFRGWGPRVFVFSHPDSNDENGNNENGNSVKGKHVADFEILKLWNQVGLIVEHVNR